MHLPTIRNKHQVDAAWDRANAAAKVSIRELAIAWLAGQIQIGRAGFDPYDEATLLIYTVEPTWAHRAADICGLVLTRSQDGRRIAMILDAEARTELGIDETSLPLMEGEPLASRGVDASLPEKLRIVDLDRSPQLQLIGSRHEPSAGIAALLDAKKAYDARTVCPTCRGTGGGQYNDCATCSGNGAVA
jgi:hypothetical protein